MVTFTKTGLMAALLLCGAVQAAELQVIATGAVKGAFKQLVPAFEQASGHRVSIAWGPSYGTSADAIPTRLGRGDPADVLVMVGAALDDRIGDGQFNPASRADVARSAIGVGVRQGAPRPDISTPDAFKRALLAAKTIGHSEGASGQYIAGTLFKQMGIADQVASRIVIVHGKELVGNAIARGDVELGLQQVSELMVVPGVDYVGPLPESLQQNSVISAIVASKPVQAEAARAFVRFLATPDAARTFAASGLLAVKPASPN